MNPPRFFTRIVGSLPIFLLLILAAIGMSYHWWTHQDTVSGWTPILALFLASIASNAHSQVDRYKQWKRAWNAMEGRTQGAPRHGTKAVFLLIPEMGLAYWLAIHPPGLRMTGEEQIAIGLFLIVTLVLIYQFAQWQRHRPAPQAKPKAEHLVSVVVSAPKSGALPQWNILPAYCHSLLTRTEEHTLHL